MLGHADVSVPYYGITDAFGLLPHLSVLPLAFPWVHGELFGELTWLRKRLFPFIWVGCQVNPSPSLVCKRTAAVPAEEEEQPHGAWAAWPRGELHAPLADSLALMRDALTSFMGMKLSHTLT